MSTAAGQVQIGILKTDLNFKSTLKYLNGNCTWIFTIRAGEDDAMGMSEGPRRVLLTFGDKFIVQCKVNENINSMQ